MAIYRVQRTFASKNDEASDALIYGGLGAGAATGIGAAAAHEAAGKKAKDVIKKAAAEAVEKDEATLGALRKRRKELGKSGKVGKLIDKYITKESEELGKKIAKGSAEITAQKEEVVKEAIKKLKKSRKGAKIAAGVGAGIAAAGVGAGLGLKSKEFSTEEESFEQRQYSKVLDWLRKKVAGKEIRQAEKAKKAAEKAIKNATSAENKAVKTAARNKQRVTQLQDSDKILGQKIKEYEKKIAETTKRAEEAEHSRDLWRVATAGTGAAGLAAGATGYAIGNHD